MKALKLIIHREYTSRVKTKAFILTTILTPFLFLAVTILPALLSSINDSSIKTVFVLDDTGLYANLFESSDTYTFVPIDDSNTQGKMDALLKIDGDLSQNPASVIFSSEQQQPPRDLVRYINDVLTEAVKAKKLENFTADSNIEPHVVSNLQDILKSKDKIQIRTMRWDTDGKSADTLGEVASMAGMVFTFCMFFFIMMYGSMVMQSVVEEKTNRIIEVIISSVKPFDLMMGKIIGVALTGLTQLLIWLGLGLVALVGISLYAGMQTTGVNAAEINQMMSMMNNNPEIASGLSGLLSINWFQVVACFILYFIGGYLLFASLFAMFGSAANDSQEAQQFITPVMAILMVAFYTGFAAARNPEGAIAFWCSLIPFTSPIVMMVRTPFEIPIWELSLSLVLLYATSILMVKLAAKIYRTGILMYGKKVSFKELFKWLSYK